MFNKMRANMLLIPPYPNKPMVNATQNRFNISKRLASVFVSTLASLLLNMTSFPLPRQMLFVCWDHSAVKPF